MAIVALILATATGCAGLYGNRRVHHANSLFRYLYPNEARRLDAPVIPTQLALPLRVGVAFVPSDNERNVFDTQTFTENHKMQLMKRVSEQFKSYPFVRSIELIPTAYLQPRGGFDNLDQLQRMYNIDVITLLSYDQVQFTDEGLLSLTYWTVVGAYVVPGEKNETRTLLDAAVYIFPAVNFSSAPRV
jgi:rhombotail lipoprotein